MIGVARPEEHWLNPWLDEYSDRLLSFVLSYTQDRDIAHDIVQETFLRLYQEHSRKPWRTLHAGWLYTVARRLTIDHYRQHRVLVLTATVPERARDIGHLNLEIDAILRDLPGLDRELLLLFYYQDWPLAKLADHYKIPVDTVKSRLHRARRRFQRLWKDGEADDGSR